MPPRRLGLRAAEVAAAARMRRRCGADALGVGVGEASAVERVHAEEVDGGEIERRRARRALERRHARRLASSPSPPPSSPRPRRRRRVRLRSPPSPSRQPAGGGNAPSPPLWQPLRLASTGAPPLEAATLALDRRDHLADVANAPPRRPRRRALLARQPARWLSAFTHNCGVCSPRRQSRGAARGRSAASACERRRGAGRRARAAGWRRRQGRTARTAASPCRRRAHRPGRPSEELQRSRSSPEVEECLPPGPPPTARRRGDARVLRRSARPTSVAAKSRMTLSGGGAGGSRAAH